MSRVIGGAFALLLGAVVLQQIGVPGRFNSYYLNVVYVGVCLFAFLYWGHRREFDVGVFVAHGVVATALLGLMLTLVATREQFLVGHRPFKVAIVYLLFVSYPLVQRDPIAFLRDAGVYYLAFAALVGAYFAHIFVGPGAYPIVMGLVVGANLFVVPRYVGRTPFLTVVSRIAGIVAALGLTAYAVGEYTVLSVRVTFWGDTFTPALSDATLPVLQSVFLNPNTTGVLLFAGTIASLVRVVEGVGRRSPRAMLPAALLIANGVALYCSQSRASMLATAVAGALYLSYVGLGRRAIPYAFASLVALAGGLLAAIYVGLIDVSSGGRFVLWWGSLKAIAADPSLFGSGLVRPDDVIEPYVDGPHSGASPHNSYLMIAIRTGLLGGVAYLVLTVGSVLAGVFGRDPIDPAILSLAAGFALHQLFEIYSIYQTLVPSVLAALAVGYLITDGSSVADRTGSTATGADAETDGASALLDGFRT